MKKNNSHWTRETRKGASVVESILFLGYFDPENIFLVDNETRQFQGDPA